MVAARIRTHILTTQTSERVQCTKPLGHDTPLRFVSRDRNPLFNHQAYVTNNNTFFCAHLHKLPPNKCLELGVNYIFLPWTGHQNITDSRITEYWASITYSCLSWTDGHQLHLHALNWASITYSCLSWTDGHQLHICMPWTGHQLHNALNWASIT